MYLDTAQPWITHDNRVHHDDVQDAVRTEIGSKPLPDEVLLFESLDVDLALQRLVVAIGDGIALPQKGRQEPVEQYDRGLKLNRTTLQHSGNRI